LREVSAGIYFASSLESKKYFKGLCNGFAVVIELWNTLISGLAVLAANAVVTRIVLLLMSAGIKSKTVP
jgi:hypothetical protein